MDRQPPGSEKESLETAQAELEQWKAKVDKADQEKSGLLLAKCDADTTKKQAMETLNEMTEAQKQLAEDTANKMKAVEMQIKSIEKDNSDLKQQLAKLQEERKDKKAEADALQRRFKIRAEIPEKRMRFSDTVAEKAELGETSMGTQGVFTITQIPYVLLVGGEALITFEEEKVARQILRLQRCSLTIDKAKMDIKPFNLSLEPSVKFEVHLNVSKKTVNVSQIPPVVPEEHLKDKLEISFSRPSRGGGEVERISYDQNSGSAQISFLNTGVAERLGSQGRFAVDMGSRAVVVDVAPHYSYDLKKFQTYCGNPVRTVLLRGIQNGDLEEEDLQDHLEIHFQKPSNSGGEVESIRYVSTGKDIRAYFSEEVDDAPDA